MNTNGHYDVIRFSIYHGAFPGQVHSLKCAHCAFSVDVRALHRAGDKSGASRYCRARARMVKHLHTAHAADLLQGKVALGRVTRLLYPYVHHIDGDPANHDLDNLEVRTGHADVGEFDRRLSELFPGQPRWTCPRCGRRTIGGYCNGCGHRYEGRADTDPDSKGRES